jgi:hypothetical protein
MDNPPPELDVLFHEALAIQDPSKRDAFLEVACGGDCLLKDQLVALIRSHESAGDFLERPIDAPGWSDRVASDSDSEQQRCAAMDAGLTSVFREDRTLLLNARGVSVFKNEPGRTIQFPQVILREGSEPKGAPIVKPTSSEMPARQPDSRYRLDGEIARGGMGAILKGRDVDLGRELAIKVLLETHMDRPEVVQRFIEEAQIGGQLQHPGIAPVYELGQFADQRPYFSMKLVKGETLSKLLSDRSSLDQDRGRFLGVFGVHSHFA